MRIEVKKRVFRLTDMNRVAFAYGVIQTPHSEDIIECDNDVSQIAWEHAYVMSIMKIKMRFPNSIIEHHRNLLSDGTWCDAYSVTEYIVSAINDDGVECAVYTMPFKSLLRLNGCKLDKLTEDVLFTRFGYIRGVDYTVDNYDIISIKLDTVKMMYSIADVAKLVGITTRTMYNWASAGHVKHHRTENGKIYFTTSDIELLQSDIEAGELRVTSTGRRRHVKKRVQ